MGVLEKEIKTKDKRKNLQKIILRTIFAVGVLGVGAVAPNVLGAIAKLQKSRQKNNRLKYSINSSITRLKEKGLVEVVEINGKKIARITQKGESKLDFLDKHNYKFKIPRKWDGRWRVVIFDIKESRKKVREQLRTTLTQVGFIKLQKSAWIYPYNCEDLVSLLKADFKLGKDVLYMIVEKLENDYHFIKAFKLPNSSGRKS